VSDNESKYRRQVRNNFRLIDYYGNKVEDFIERIFASRIGINSEDITKLEWKLGQHLDILYHELRKAIESCDIPEMNGLNRGLVRYLDESDTLEAGIILLSTCSEFFRIIESLNVEAIRNLRNKLGVM